MSALATDARCAGVTTGTSPWPWRPGQVARAGAGGVVRSSSVSSHRG